MNRKIRKCPYCKSKVSYFGALSELNSGEHTCSVCYKNSNISYDKTIYIPAAVLLVISLILAIMFFIFKIIENLILALVLILVPFAVFYFLTPLFYHLEEIKNESQNPVIRYEPKRVARAEKQSRILKSDENAKVEYAKKEQRSSEIKNSGESKFAKFIRTYVILPDDDEEEINNIRNANNHETELEDVTEKKSDTTQNTNIVRENKIEIVSENNDNNVDAIIDDPFVDLETEVIITQQNVVEEVSENARDGDKTKIEESKANNIPKVMEVRSLDKYGLSEIKIEANPKKSDDKPKLNFGRLFSKLNFSDNKMTEALIINNNSGVESVVDKEHNTEHKPGEPVYHRLTKTSKVNFIYYPDKKAVISVDLSSADEKTEEFEIDRTGNISPAEIAVTDENKIITAETDTDKANIAETEKSVENTAAEIVEADVQTELSEAIGFVVEKTLEAEQDDEENREILNFFSADPSESEEREFGENPKSESAAEMNTEVSSERVSQNDNSEKGNWVEYTPETGDFITIDLRKNENQNIEANNSINNIISLSDVSFDISEGENIDNTADNIDDGFIEYDAQDRLPVIVINDIDTIDTDAKLQNNSKDSRSMFGILSEYASKIKNESVFNLDKLAKSVESVLKNEVKINEATETPADILEFNEELHQEIEVKHVIKFESEFESGNVPDEAADLEADFAEEISDTVDIDKMIQSDTNDELLRNVTEIDIDNISATNNYFGSAESDLETDIDTSVDFDDISEEEILDNDEDNAAKKTNSIDISDKSEKLVIDTSKIKPEFEINYDSAVEEVENADLVTIEIPKKRSSYDKQVIYKSEEFIYDENSKNNDDVKDDEYYTFDEEDEDDSETIEESSEQDDEYYTFDEEDEDDSESVEESSEQGDEYFKFNEEIDGISEKDDEYYKFDEEDDDEEVIEAVEGSLEYVPEEKNDDSYVVDYSEDKFEDISSGEQLDENFDLEKIRAEGILEKAPEEPVIPVKIDSRGNRVDGTKQQSRYEKKFPNAAKAAAEEAAALEIKQQKERQKAKAAQAKKKKSDSKAVNADNDQQNKNTNKKKNSQSTKKKHKTQEHKTGFLSGLKNKIIEATEEERQAAFEEEERERKLAEKEARRKAKEKEKERAEKQKAREEKEQIRSSAGVSTAKDGYEKLARQSVEERKKISQKTKRIEKSKVNIPANIPADGKTIVFDSIEKSDIKEFDAQEKIVLESVKDKVKELENKKVTQAEKVKIISEKVDEEKRREKIEQLKNEQEQQRIRKEKERRENQLRNERLEKAEELRQKQVDQVRKERDKRNKTEQKRNTGSVSLKEVDNVRSKVSQKKKKRKKQVDEVL